MHHGHCSCSIGPETCCVSLPLPPQVATPQDPASACRGETLWAFLPRTVWGNVVDGYRAEAQRLTARGLPLLSLHNRHAVGRRWWVKWDGVGVYRGPGVWVCE